MKTKPVDLTPAEEEEINVSPIMRKMLREIRQNNLKIHRQVEIILLDTREEYIMKSMKEHKI